MLAQQEQTPHRQPAMLLLIYGLFYCPPAILDSVFDACGKVWCGHRLPPNLAHCRKGFVKAGTVQQEEERCQGAGLTVWGYDSSLLINVVRNLSVLSKKKRKKKAAINSHQLAVIDIMSPCLCSCSYLDSLKAVSGSWIKIRVSSQ